ncbi:MAG TPA: phosphatase PAP2 family protein [Flavisolibacter sp.]|jgi:membrane-associated phospholipid phosphatase|nr:phosphatase PAP2 family protein [Flavisolibacter sp.]
MSRFLSLFAFVFCCTPCFSQQPDAVQVPVTDSILVQAVPPDSFSRISLATTSRISAREFVLLQIGSLKEAFTKPFHMSGRNWGDVGKFALVMGALSFADRPVQQLAFDVRNSNKEVTAVSHQVTRFGGPYVVYALGALGSYGFLFKNEKLQTTTLLSVQAFITSGILERTVKLVAGRQRPFIISSAQGGPEPLFHGPVYMFRESREDRFGSSFPSGHTTAAFAVATVFAESYKDKPWIPAVAYSAATLVGVSRLTENKHWITDVVAGAALGYISGKQAVRNYRRHTGLKTSKSQKPKMSFTVALNQGVVTPGFVYHF